MFTRSSSKRGDGRVSGLAIKAGAAAGAAKLARLDGASYPTTLTRAAVAFTATLTLAAALAAL